MIISQHFRFFLFGKVATRPAALAYGQIPQVHIKDACSTTAPMQNTDSKCACLNSPSMLMLLTIADSKDLQTFTEPIFDLSCGIIVLSSLGLLAAEAHLEEANKVLLVFRRQLCHHAHIQQHQLGGCVHLHPLTPPPYPS